MLDSVEPPEYRPTMLLELTPELVQRLRQLSEEMQSSPDELAQKALKDFVSEQEERLASLRTAEEEADRIGWLTSEQVLDRISKRFIAA